MIEFERRRTWIIAIVTFMAVLWVIAIGEIEIGHAGGQEILITRASGQISTNKTKVSAPSVSSKFSIDAIGQIQLQKGDPLSMNLNKQGISGKTPSSTVGGPICTVKKIYVCEGERISKGQKMMILDDRIFVLKVQKNQAMVEEAQAQRATVDEKEDQLKKGRGKINKAINEMQSGIIQIEQKEQELQDTIALLKQTQGQTETQVMPDNTIPSSLTSDGVSPDIPQSPEELQKVLEELRAKKRQLENQLSKVKRQKSKLVSALDSLESGKGLADAAVLIAQINLDKSKRDLEKTVITAPTSGVISKQSVQEGEAVFPNQSLFMISDLNKVTLTIYLPEEQARLVRKGQGAIITIDSYPNRVFRSTVKSVADVVEFAPTNLSTNLTHLAYTQWISIDIENNKGILKDGMPADAEFLKQK